MVRKRIIYITLGILLALAVVVLAGGPLLSALGVEVFCIEEENGRTRLVRCGGSKAISVDTNPPQIAVDAQPTLIDTDMAADDWMAILYLLQRPDVDIRAITVTGAGEAHCDPGVQNALDLAALAGRPEIPVTCGRETPLEGEHVFPPSWGENVDELAGVSIPKNPSPPAAQNAASLIANTIQDAGGDLEIIALGPLTNLAETFLLDPSLAEMIKQVYIMGGAFSVPGNVSDAPEMEINNLSAEWNIYVDPRAAALVVGSGVPITFVPLDATNQVVLDDSFYKWLAGDRATPEAEFIFQVLTENIGFVRSGDYYFWDPLAAAIAVDEGLGVFEIRPVSIIVEEGPDSGATRFDDVGSQVRIVTDAAAEKFKQYFLDGLNGRVAD